PPPPPIGPARPVQAYFAKGKLLVRVIFQQLEYERQKLVTGEVLTCAVDSKRPLIPLQVDIDPANVQAFNHRGEPLRQSEWVRLLKKEKPALLCSGCRIDPEFLPLLREGTLIFQVPRDEILIPRVPAKGFISFSPQPEPRWAFFFLSASILAFFFSFPPSPRHFPLLPAEETACCAAGPCRSPLCLWDWPPISRARNN